MRHFTELIYLMLPVYFANMAPPFVKYWHGWNPPISRRYLGDHKTTLGFILGIATALAVALLQSRIQWVGSLVSYDQWISIGVATGLGAMLGDSIKSFFKRRLKISPGESWIPFDQLDFVCGGILALEFWYSFAWLDVIEIVVFSFAADIIVNHVSFFLGIRSTKW